MKWSAVTHTCCVCGFQWQSMDKETERHVLKAVKVNKDGPYCSLCQSLEMAERFASARGYKTIYDALNDWIISKAKRAESSSAEPSEDKQPK